MKPARATCPSRPAASRGVTLVELMVAITIGLGLTVVIAQLFLGSRQTFSTTDDVSRMQENMRFIEQLLIRTVHQAGYKSSPNSVTNTIFPAPPSTNAALDGVEGGGTVSDQITVRYQGSRAASGAADGSVLDCLGNRVDAGVIKPNSFSIRATGQLDSLGQPINGLFCSVDNGNNWVEIARNVENMQIVYGDDTDADLSANRFVKRNDIADANMVNVNTVRISLLFSTPTETSKTTPDAVTTYNLNGTNGTTLGPFPNDRRIRRVLTTTINLRNRTP